MSIIESAISKISPRWAYNRSRYREAFAAYEAAKPSRLRKNKGDNSSGNTVVGKGAVAIRGYARDLEQNYDVVEGALKVLVNNTIGANGINREPIPKNMDGEINSEFSDALLGLWDEWAMAPEVTGQFDNGQMERLAARTWFRDGELLAQMLEGKVPGLIHGSRVPFSIELIEADQLPMGYYNKDKGIKQGIECNAWGRPTAFHVYKDHPGDQSYVFDSNTKRVPANKILHPKIVNRIRQLRGVSIFASVIRRIEDLKDYEESERIAARVAAALTAYIKKGQAEEYKAPTDKKDRHIKMKPGLIFDDLHEGEEIGTIDSNRPSGLLTQFHETMTRLFCSGIGANHSSVSKNYKGSFSSQRQELSEGWVNYSAITAMWVAQFSRPVWRRFVNMAVLSGAIKIPDDLDIKTLYDAEYYGPSQPWIDPKKEADGLKALERSGYKPAQQTIRERGGNPRRYLTQIKYWRDEANKLGLVFDTDPKHDKGAIEAEEPKDKDDEDDDEKNKTEDD